MHGSNAFTRVAEALRLEIANGEVTSVDAVRGGRTSARIGVLMSDLSARNRMLDSCGSDLRPLVDLLLGVGPLVQARLGEPGRESSEPWTARRAPIVHAIVATRFLQSDVARWTVDAWAVALGVLPPTTLVAPQVESERAATMLPNTTTTSAGAANNRHRVGARNRPAPTPGVTTKAFTPAASAAVAARYRIGSKAAPYPRPMVPVNPRFAARMHRLERAATISFMLLALTVIVLLSSAIAGIRSRPVAPGAPRVPVPASSPAVAPATSSSGSAPSSAAAVIRAPSPAPAEMMREAHDSAFVRDAALSAAAIRAALARGVGGSYTVMQQTRSVDGSVSCSTVAYALREPRSSVEHIMHTPGSRELTLTSRRTSGRVYDDGRFELGPTGGTTNGVRWTFRMRGQFTPDGFTGQSETETFAVIRWGRTQSCIALADIVATRL